ncbi:hypothetical protein KP509_39G020000 [Ceratopteris richardii]|uniref:Uncharacterized protein n=1 Tax=Ceratopteris richardii TaxID=49495 RepID=A0A8T2PZA5_CERRI|nr:hypothetical protein KP509_39G020000 [Ceratopteris richardii]
MSGTFLRSLGLAVLQRALVIVSAYVHDHVDVLVTIGGDAHAYHDTFAHGYHDIFSLRAILMKLYALPIQS